MELNEKELEKQENSMSVHVFSVSAAMVGVCITVIQLIQMNHQQRIVTIADDILAFDTLLFVVACFTSFMDLRTKNDQQSKKKLEKIAGIFFLIGLSIMAMVSPVVVFALF